MVNAVITTNPTGTLRRLKKIGFHPTFKTHWIAKRTNKVLRFFTLSQANAI